MSLPSDQTAQPDPRIKPVMSANHALLVGELIGAAKSLSLDAEPLLDDKGNYMATFRVKRPSGNYLVTVVPE
jgi:hypothetical protein